LDEPVGKNWTLIGAVCKQFLQEWKLAKQRGEQQQAAIAVLNPAAWTMACGT
jgi:hypothetical protein